MSVKKWSLGTVETGKVVASSGGKLKIWVGKIMPFIKFDKPKSKLVSLNKNCILNDSKCKPNISSQVHTINYMTVPIDVKKIPDTSIKKGTEVRIEVRNHSVDQLTVTSCNL